MKNLLILNGLDHAFLREFGCSCNRCAKQRRLANTSVSLISLDDNGRVLRHVLFDIGMGVVNSLVDSPYLSGDKARLDWLIISHWHPDHVLDLNRLCETWRRTFKRRGEQWKRIPTWCRSGTAEWLKRNQAYEWTLLEPHLSGEVIPPGIDPGVKLGTIEIGIDGLRITPITVSHCTADMHPETRQLLYCCASFVIKIKDKKAVLLWDVDNKNDWIEKPTNVQQEETVELLSNADYLFVDCNTWNAEIVNGRNTGHIAFSTVKRYVKALNPKLTLLVHLSGHEDGEGNPGWGWLDRDWEKAAQKAWKDLDLPGEVHVPRIGEEFGL